MVYVLWHFPKRIPLMLGINVLFFCEMKFTFLIMSLVQQKTKAGGDIDFLLTIFLMITFFVGCFCGLKIS